MAYTRPQLILIVIAVVLFLGMATWVIDALIPADLFGPSAELVSEEATLETRPVEKSLDTISAAGRIAERGSLLVGVKYDFKPFGYLNENGEVVGFDVDLAREFARRWLGDPEAIEFIEVTSSNRIPSLAGGAVDLVMASMTHKRERDALIDFSQTYFLDGQSLLVRTETGISEFAQLEGKTVAAIQGSTAIDNIQREAEVQGISLEILPFQEYIQAVAALTAGVADAVTNDSVALTQSAAENPDLTLIGERFTAAPYGIGVPQGESDFRELVNFTLQDMKADGSYDQLYQKWFPTDQPYAIELTPGQVPYTLNAMPTDPAPKGPSRIQDILSRGRIVAGVRGDLDLFGVRDGDNNFQGFDIDLVKEFARRWLGDAEAVEFMEVSAQTPIEGLMNGQLDLVAAALVHQRDWADRIDYSQSYLGAPQVADAYSIGVPQYDSLFRELVNFTLQEMKADGSYDQLYSQWFGNDIPAYNVQVLPGNADYLLLPYRDAENIPRITQATDSMIKRIRERENLMIVGIRQDVAPFGFVDEDGELNGFDIDLINALAEVWGVTVQFEPVSATDRIQKLVTGEVDLIAAAMPHTKEWEETIDFSQTYFLDGQSLLVRRNSGINRIQDLNEKVVGALTNTSYVDQLLAYAEANLVTVEPLSYGSYEEALVGLAEGEIDALTADFVTLSQLVKTDEETVIVGGLFTQIPYGLGLPAGDSYFNNLVNFTLQQLKVDGRYDQLYGEWFSEQTTPFALQVLPGQWPYSFADSPTQLDKPVLSKVEEILSRGRLVAGVKYDFKPFGYWDESRQQVTGFDTELIREFAKRWLGDAEAVEFVPVSASDREQKLAAGQVDMIAAAMTHAQERDEHIDFSQTYFLDGQSLLVRADSEIGSLVDLEGMTVAAIQGSAAIENIQAIAAQAGTEIELLPFQEYPQALKALEEGQVDSLTTAHAALTQFAADNPSLRVIDDLLTLQPYGLGVPNYDERFQDLVNFTLQEMKLDGTYDRLYSRWFGEAAQENGIFALETWPGESYLDVNMTPMVRIPGGDYVRGNNAGFPDEKPEQQLYLDDFFIDQYEVTNRQYGYCVKAGRCTLPRLPRSVNFGRYYAESDFGNYPVIWVSWTDAANYCGFVGKRLPTEAEWEKAARSASGFLYPWGNDEPTDQANFAYAERDVVPVGSYEADVSVYGVHDMAGNVREWVTDWYQWDYYQVAPVRNPTGPEEGVTKVLRGGSWNDIALSLRTTVRKNFLPDSFDSNLGFRCANSTFPR